MTLGAARGYRKRETLTKIPVEVGLGHVTKLDPNVYRPGHSHRTYDVNLDTPVSVAQRTGVRVLCENGIGATKITDFEEAIGAGAGQWSAGFVTNDSAVDADGTRHWRQFEVAAQGTMGKRITATGAGTAFQSFLDLSAAPLNLGLDLDEFICWWMYVDDKSRLDQAGLKIRVTLESVTPNVDVFTYSPVSATLKDRATDGAPWNFMAVRKRDFTVAGAADWANIRRIGIKIACNNAAGTFVTFDNMWLGPKQTDGLFNFLQSPKRGGGNFKIGAARGVLAYLDEFDQRWVPLASDLAPYQPVTFQPFTDFLYAGTGAGPVKVVLGDGVGGLSAATTFNAGISAPEIAATTATVLAGGVLPVGIHEYRFEFYSALTGLPGSSGLLKVLAVPATAADVKIRLDNLPVSADPKVGFLRIYRRDATATRFRRVVELANGTPSYEDNIASLGLSAELQGFPTYAISDPPPQLSMFALVGGRMIGAGDPIEPGVLYASRPNNGEQWDLIEGPTRLDLNDNDYITSVFDAFGYGGAGKRGSVYIGTAQPGSPSGFSWLKRSDESGPISHRGVVKRENLIFYRGVDGFYKMGRDYHPRKASRLWDTSVAAPGVIEPTFKMFDSRDAQRVCGAYNKDRSQVMWNDKLLRDPIACISPVYHMAALESDDLTAAVDGSQGAWAFHRFGLGSTVHGTDCMANYVESLSGKDRVMSAGPGGFVYEIDSDEIDDVMPTGRFAIDADVTMAFAGQRGIALGQHHLKDYVYHDMVFVPMGNWVVDLEYYFDWNYRPFPHTVTPVGTDPYALAAQPFLGGPFYAETGTYTRIVLESGRHRNVAWRMRNNRLGESFHLSEAYWFMEYLGGEGAI